MTQPSTHSNTPQAKQANQTRERLFATRHVGPAPSEVATMLETLELASLADLIKKAIPAVIRVRDENESYPHLSKVCPESEQATLVQFKKLMQANQCWRSYIGLGYYGTIVPPVILRNLFENPSWYTAYTPYQAEISQGRLELLINFQTLVTELLGMDVANASLLDEATAAAEAMTLMRRLPERKNAKKLYVSDELFPQTLAVLRTRALPLGITLTCSSFETFQTTVLATEQVEDYFGAIIPYQGADGSLFDVAAMAASLKAAKLRVTVMSDLLASVVVKAPGECGADIACGSAQRFGVPMGFGGPHAAFFAVKDAFKRQLPGRLIGLSKDAQGKKAYRMALQTREQHIRREKATSNICTAQALLANMAAAYAIYHGKDGLVQIAQRVHHQTRELLGYLQALPPPAQYKILTTHTFDTIVLALDKEACRRVYKNATRHEINLRYGRCHQLGTRVHTQDLKAYPYYVALSLDETVTSADLGELKQIFKEALTETTGVHAVETQTMSSKLPVQFQRTTPPLAHEIFSFIHSETQMLRYLYQLEQKDVALNRSMISLGSCTMKLNATSEMLPLSWETVNSLHPLVPYTQAQGYQRMLAELLVMLKEVTGFAGISLQPNSGAQGEFAGLLAIRSYQQQQKQAHRCVALIPVSAHGTNPVSAVMAGMQPVFIKCLDNGDIDREDFAEKCQQHKQTLAVLMITYPSTHGVFEEDILWMTEQIHAHGGQVYMDGANMNAQVGFSTPARIGADVCHLNLHKTFAIPHGGGGPGMGPIGVREHLVPYLPQSPFSTYNDGSDVGGGDLPLDKHWEQALDTKVPRIAPKGHNVVAATSWSSASILAISYLYMKMLGLEGLKQATAMAILNANYLRQRLAAHYNILYTARNGFVAHEMILDVRPFKQSAKISAEDIAKRLIDYGFHAPTMSWPVAGTLMVEPTESEDKEELDRFADALIQIRKEIAKVEDGTWTATNNPLKNAPHTAEMLLSATWDFSYTREEAAYPLPYLRQNKYWTPVGRIDNVHGDRNLFCVCPPLSAYVDGAEKAAVPVAAGS